MSCSPRCKREASLVEDGQPVREGEGPEAGGLGRAANGDISAKSQVTLVTLLPSMRPKEKRKGGEYSFVLSYKWHLTEREISETVRFGGKDSRVDL